MNLQHDPGHGESPAAWTTVTISLITISAGALFFWLNMPELVWVSGIATLLSPVVGVIMAKAGYGVKGPKYKAKH